MLRTIKLRLVTAFITVAAVILLLPAGVSADFYGYWSQPSSGLSGVMSMPYMYPGVGRYQFIGNSYELSRAGGEPAIRVGIRFADDGYNYFHAYVYSGGAEDYFPMNPVVGTLPNGQNVDDTGQLMFTYLNMSQDDSWYAVGFSTPHGSIKPFAGNCGGFACSFLPSWIQMEQVTQNADIHTLALNGVWAYNSWTDSTYTGHYFTQPNGGLGWNGPFVIAPTNTYWYILPSQSTTGGQFIACYRC